ncbi:MAG: type II secretion system minor pseudopilin GspK [Gammaproteobacteria bacterium]|nr:type II secretion system minor pseudopilin GspK [Gammaproteobacteria bacterium]
MRKDQSGVALITAILVVALASIAAATILSSAHVAIRRTALLQDTEKAWWVAYGLESWVKSILQRDRADNQVDHLGEDWAQPVDHLPLDEGFARGGVVDLQGRFNLNNLGAQNPQPYVDQFRRLLLELAQEKEVEIQDPNVLIGAIRDWMDRDDLPGSKEGPGAEDTDYLNLDPPYRAANRPFASVSELLAVRGMSKELYAVLRPYVCALPEITPVNVNTASPELLRALSAQPDEAKLSAFVGSQKEEPAEDKQTPIQDGVFGADLDPNMISVSSRYFQLRGEIVVGSGRVALYSSIYRPDQGSPVVLDHGTDE